MSAGQSTGCLVAVHQTLSHGCVCQIDDSEAFARDRRSRHPPGIPCISAGQSMGGLIATHLVLRDQSAWAGLILCSAAIDVEWTFVLRQALLNGPRYVNAHTTIVATRAETGASQTVPGSCAAFADLTFVSAPIGEFNSPLSH